MLRTGTNILRTNVLKKCFQITIKVCFSQRCISIAPKTETVTRDSKFFKSDMSRKSGLFFKSVPYVTETGAPMWTPFSLDVTPFYGDTIKCSLRIRMLH